MANKALKSIKFPGLSDTYTVPEVDSTLTGSGKAADAKAVGDQLGDLKSALKTNSPLTGHYTNKYADALLDVKLSSCNVKLYLKAIYKKRGTNERYAIEFRDDDEHQIVGFLADHYTELDKTVNIRIYEANYGLNGLIRIDWSVIPDDTLAVFASTEGGQLGIPLAEHCYPEYNVTASTLQYDNIPVNNNAVSAALNEAVNTLNQAIDTAKNDAYPLTKSVLNNALIDIRFTEYDSSKVYYLYRIGRNASIGGGRYAYFVDLYDGDNNRYLILNILSDSYTEKEENAFSVNGLSGTFWINWEALTSGQTVSYNLIPFSKSCFVRSNLENRIDVLENTDEHDTYPFVKYADTPIIDIWFDEYDATKKYRLAAVGRKITIGTTVTTYVDVQDDSGTRYLLLNVRSESYTEKEENTFSVNGLTGKFWIDWSKVEEGTQVLWNRATGLWFSRLCFAVSNLRSDIAQLKDGTEDTICLIPDKIYGVVGHPFSIYFYQIFQMDSLEDRHFSVVNHSARMRNLGDRIRFDCTEAATYTTTIRMRKNNRNNLWTSKTITIQILPETIPSIKAMFIGDSFTDGGKMQAELKRMMGNALTTYGTRTFSTTDSEGNVQTGYDEGRSSWSWAHYTERSEKGSTTNAFWDGTAFNFSYYMAQHPEFADVTDVFLLSGPNDYDTVEANYIARMNIIVNSIKAYSSNIRIHCMMPLTCNCLGYAWGMLNAGGGEEFRYRMFDYGQAILDTYGNDTQCSVVPTHVNFNRLYDFPKHEVAASDRNPTLVEVYNDNVHPNEYGYFSMADMIFGDIVANCQ